MIHTESSIDIDADDPVVQYWRESTDYAGTFVPFDTYAYDIITDVNRGVQGYGDGTYYMPTVNPSILYRPFKSEA